MTCIVLGFDLRGNLKILDPKLRHSSPHRVSFIIVDMEVYSISYTGALEESIGSISNLFFNLNFLEQVGLIEEESKLISKSEVLKEQSTYIRNKKYSKVDSSYFFEPTVIGKDGSVWYRKISAVKVFQKLQAFTPMFFDGFLSNPISSARLHTNYILRDLINTYGDDHTLFIEFEESMKSWIFFLQGISKKEYSRFSNIDISQAAIAVLSHKSKSKRTI